MSHSTYDQHHAASHKYESSYSSLQGALTYPAAPIQPDIALPPSWNPISFDLKGCKGEGVKVSDYKSLAGNLEYADVVVDGAHANPYRRRNPSSSQTMSISIDIPGYGTRSYRILVPVTYAELATKICANIVYMADSTGQRIDASHLYLVELKHTCDKRNIWEVGVVYR